MMEIFAGAVVLLIGAGIGWKLCLEYHRGDALATVVEPTTKEDLYADYRDPLTKRYRGTRQERR